jgi:hypothetical protein
VTDRKLYRGIHGLPPQQIFGLMPSQSHHLMPVMAVSLDICYSAPAPVLASSSSTISPILPAPPLPLCRPLLPTHTVPGGRYQCLIQSHIVCPTPMLAQQCPSQARCPLDVVRTSLPSNTFQSGALHVCTGTSSLIDRLHYCVAHATAD